MHLHRYVLLLVLASLLLLTGCGQQPPAEPLPATKQSFFITTATPAELQTTATLKKTGRIESSTEITVSAQVAGRVTSIHTRLGDEVATKESLLQLTDTAGMLTFAVQRAAESLQQAKVNQQQSLQNLDQSLQETQIAVEQAQNQATNAALGNQMSAANAQLESARQSVQRAELDYENKLLADEQTIQSFLHVSENLAQDVLLLYETVLNDTDMILGVSHREQAANDIFEPYLGARNTATKFAAEQELRVLLRDYEDLQRMPRRLSEQTLLSDLDEMLQATRNLTTLLMSIDTMLQRTITNPLYPETQLLQHTTLINTLQSQVQNQISALTQQITTIETFLRTYEDTQASFAKNVELAESSYQLAKANLEAAATNAQLQVKSVTTSYQGMKNTTETTKASLQNAIDQAQISYNEAQFDLSKLAVVAPISWRIATLLVDVGQEVAPGTPLFTLANTTDQEISIQLTAQEVAHITKGQQVRIQDGPRQLSWLVESITQSANDALTYEAIVNVNGNVPLLGTVVHIELATQIESSSLPLRVVTIKNPRIGSLTLRDGTTLQTIDVQLGSVRGDRVEVTSPIDPSRQIVTSDIHTYDPELFEIEVRTD